MATEVEITTAIETAQAQQGLSGLRKGLKELISLQGQVGSDSKQFVQLQKAINTTEGKIGDLTDSFQTLRGSGVERVNSSMAVFREGLLNADTGKLKLGLQGIGAAMKAIPIFLLIEGVQLLIQNFDKVVALFKTGKTASDQLTESLRLQAIASKEVANSFEREIALSQAYGLATADIIKLQIEKGEASLKSMVAEEKALYNLIAAKEKEGEATDEEKKKLEELNDKYQSTLTDTAALYLKLEKVREEDAKKQQEEAKRLAEKEKAESDRRIADFQAFLKERNAQQEAIEQDRIALENRLHEEELKEFEKQLAKEKQLRQEELDFIAALEQAEVEIRKTIREQESIDALTKFRNDAAFENALVLQTTAERIAAVQLLRDQALAQEQLTVDQRVEIVRKAEDDILAIRTEAQLKSLELANQYAQVLSGLNELQNQKQIKQLKALENAKNKSIANGSKTQIEAEAEYLKASLKIKKEQFEREKILKIANIAIDTASALVKTTAQLGGVGAATPAGIALLGGIAALGVTQALVVANQEFDDSGFTTPTVPEINTSGDSAPTSERTPERTPTPFNPQARVNGQQGGVTRVVVLQSDIKEVSQQVEVLESRATFGVN